jgi:hypothetical protein
MVGAVAIEMVVGFTASTEGPGNRVAFSIAVINVGAFPRLQSNELKCDPSAYAFGVLPFLFIGAVQSLLVPMTSGIKNVSTSPIHNASFRQERGITQRQKAICSTDTKFVNE